MVHRALAARIVAGGVLLFLLWLVALLLPLPGPVPSHCVYEFDSGMCQQGWFWNCLLAHLVVPQPDAVVR